MKSSNLNIWTILTILLVGISNISFAEKTIYVDADAKGANNGTSWIDAYNYLQEALNDANSAEKPVEIKVAQGTYKPNGGLVAIPEFDWKTTAFQLINRVTIEGGYAGFGELDPDARNIDLYKTILSGDLNGDDSMNLWLFELDNSYHVTTSSGTDPNAVLDGFTITGGQGPQGGGMYNDAGSPTIKNCTFNQNDAHNGGGMCNANGSNPTLLMCTFSENYVNSNDTPGSGGGMYNQNSNPVLIDCTFSQNVALSSGVGGGMANYQSNPTIIRCTFTDNSIEGSSNELVTGGGAIFSDQSNLVLVSSLLIANSALNGTGGAINNVRSTINLINCTFAANRASYGTSLACWQTWQKEKTELSSAFITNSILWDDSFQIWNEEGSLITISYTDIQGSQAAVNDPLGMVVWGDGNIDADPNFASSGYWGTWNDPSVVAEPNDTSAVWIDGDYHLQSEAGRWDPKGGVWVLDEVTSPCIDKGDITSPFDLEPLPNGGRINMGVYGGTIEASKSTATTPPDEPDKGKT
ncbi:MAG: hypothetical protein A2167_03105 [Planctomycetes bacterium RBG_13_46_10]|nr:MAG: hypothetical protein A2167_03105 [Planctomycetes bacterium RBG_13_46_10]